LEFRPLRPCIFVLFGVWSAGLYHQHDAQAATMKFKRRKNFDPAFRLLTLFCGLLILAVMAGILAELVKGSRLSLDKFGLGFLFSQAWNPVTGEFGAASSIYGTLVSTAIAMIIAVPLSLIIALFLVELAPPRLSRLVGGAIELLAAIPSIIYGMWGLFVFAPFMADYVQPYLARATGNIPLFQGPPMGIGMLTAGIILALMILPFITSVTRDVFQMVPIVVKESAYGMGSTTWEVTRKVTVPYGIQGVLGACFLGLGRAIGETMAVTFVIGNRHEIALSLFSAGNSIASTLANEFTEAVEDIYLSSLVELGLVLFGVTVLIQIAAQLWLKRTRRKMGTGL
jgi:phosphate transport system permease protein